MSNKMPISEERREEVAAAARPIVQDYHANLVSKMEEVIAKNLPKAEEDAAIFLIIDSYQTAYVSMATHLNTLRQGIGGTTTMLHMPNIPGVTDIKPSNPS